MRTSLLSRGRQVTSRICANCSRQQRALSTPTPRHRPSIVATTSQQPSSLARLTQQPQAPCFLSTSSQRARPPPSEATAASPAADTTADNETTLPQPPPESHYAFFPQTLPSGPPPAGPFAIDQRTLRREFLQLQAKAHPDLHPPHLKPRAEATSARINEAYKTLSSPLLRAQYLLDRHFAASESGTHPASDEAAKVEDPELLMQVLEAREIIEDAESEAELEGIKAENDARIRDSEEALGVYFAGGDLESAKHECVKLRYWVNIADTLHHWERGKPVVLEH